MHQSQIPCLTLENAFGDEPFELSPSPGLLQIRSKTVLWQKERLLNLAARWLPKKYTNIVWLDCDILFDNPNWINELEKQLEHYPIAQVWTTADRLNEKGESEGNIVTSFAKVMKEDSQVLNLSTTRYDHHGHTGYGWAMRRSLFDKIGLYEGAIAGNADHFMAHAIFGDLGHCIQNSLGKSPHQLSHLKDWSDQFFDHTQGKLGVVSGNIRHLWHGDAKNRRYFLRQWDLAHLCFNPWTDLKSIPGHPLEWSPDVLLNKKRLVEYFNVYFQSRQEDG